jgi:hypothetical protein
MNRNITNAQWIGWSTAEKSQFVSALAEELSGRFHPVPQIDANRLPVFLHSQSKIDFRFVPGGEFEFGLTEANEKAARAIADPPRITLSEVRPVTRKSVNAFLVGVTPLLWNQCAGYKITATKPSYRSEFSPASLTRSDTLLIGKQIGCRLPAEIEWEYACRAATDTLFPWGDQLPDSKTLKKWLEMDFSSLDRLSANNFGLYGMFTGEWCHDEYRKSHEPSAEICTGAYVIKGGGALFWPWQDEEWVWCAPSIRMPSTGLIGSTAACRFVFPL